MCVRGERDQRRKICLIVVRIARKVGVLDESCQHFATCLQQRVTSDAIRVERTELVDGNHEFITVPFLILAFVRISPGLHGVAQSHRLQSG